MITVIGDALLDVHVVPAMPLRPGGDVPAEIRLEPGGQGANVAVRLARQGLGVRLACALGTDAAGDLLRERLAADHVELVDLGSEATGAVVVLRDANGERTMLSQRVSLGRRLSALTVADADWLVVSGYVLLEPDAGISGSGDSPRRVLLGCSLDAAQVASWLARAASLAPHLVVLNADEARVICGADGRPAELGGEGRGAVADDRGRHRTLPERPPRSTGGRGRSPPPPPDRPSTPPAPVMRSRPRSLPHWPPRRGRRAATTSSERWRRASAWRRPSPACPGAQARVEGERA